MRTEPPPPRYRVIERGRRLEVIDTTTGEAAVASARPGTDGATTTRWPTWPAQSGFDGRAVLTTHRWYDAKAPRRVLLDPGTMQWIGVAKGAAIGAATVAAAVAVTVPALLVVFLLPLALLRPSYRDALRTAATGWLDRIGAPPGR